MVDQTINRHSSMDVVLESQTQLVSRIGLATKSGSKLSFLHGEIGVGKSHVANLLQHDLSNVHTVKLQLKSTIEPEQLKQQIICELATDELSDLNQPISTAVYKSICHKNFSILLIIDNAEFIPQQALNALWQSIHELNRLNQTNFTFNVFLIGASRWALPMYSGLKNKTDSLVAEFALTPLTKQQAIDFMMSVHADWSDLKIQQFINKIAPDYLTPKQLVYAQVPSVNSHKQKILIGISIIVLLLISVAIVGNLSVDKVTPVVEAPKLAVSSLAIEENIQVDENKINNLKVESIDDEILNANPVIELTDNVSLQLDTVSQEIVTEISETADKENIVAITDNIPPVIGKELVDTDNLETQSPNTIIMVKGELKATEVESVGELEDLVETTNNYAYDEQYLLNVPISNYALMLGGYSSSSTLLTMQARFKDQSLVYQYETIREQRSWFVLLYGIFDTLEEANQFIRENKAVFKDFSPWAKPLRSIQKEIEVSQ